MPVTSSKVALWNRAMIKIGTTKFIQTEDDTSAAAEVCSRVHDDLIRQLLEARPWYFARFQKPLVKINEQAVTYTGAAVDGAIVDFNVPYPYLYPDQVAITLDGVDQVVVTDYTFADVDPGETKYITMTVAPGTNTTLVITVTTTRYGWRHIFALPTDFIKGIGLLYGNDTLTPARFELQAQHQRIPHSIYPNDEKNGYILACDLDDSDFDQLEYTGDVTDLRVMPREFIDALVLLIAAELHEGIRKDPKAAKAVRDEGWYAASKAFARDINHRGRDLVPTTPGLAVRGGIAYSYDDGAGGFNR